nr:MAG TPA: hypothetical protein [Caudoviricetes sp.]
MKDYGKLIRKHDLCSRMSLCVRNLCLKSIFILSARILSNQT